MRNPHRQSPRFPGIAPRHPSSTRPTCRIPHPSPRPVAREGSLGRRTEAAAGAERTGVLSNCSSSVARAGQGRTQRKAAMDQAGGSGVKGAARERGPIPGSGVDGLKQRASAAGHQDAAIDPTPIKTSIGPSDGAFDPSAREVPVRVEGVTRTVPGLHAGAACPSWAPGVAAKNGACPELMSNSSRGASAFVETVLLICLRAKPRRPAQPFHRPRFREAGEPVSFSRKGRTKLRRPPCFGALTDRFGIPCRVNINPPTTGSPATDALVIMPWYDQSRIGIRVMRPLCPPCSPKPVRA
jgi:hypothetical protein